MSALHRGYRTFAVHHEKAWFLRFSRSLLITYLFSLCLEKKYIVLEKVWKKKSWILDPKICTNPVCGSYLDKTLHFLNSFDTWKLRATEPQVTFTQRIAGSVTVSVQLSCHCLEFRAETRTLEWCFSTWNSTQAGIKEFSSGKRKRNKYRL